MRPIVTDSVVCRSVCLSHCSEPCKNGYAVWVENSGGSREWGPDPLGRGIFEGEGASHCKVWGHSAVICAKSTAEPISTLFGLCARMGPSNHVLDGGPDPPSEGAILGERGDPL